MESICKLVCSLVGLEMRGYIFGIQDFLIHNTFVLSGLLIILSHQRENKPCDGAAL